MMVIDTHMCLWVGVCHELPNWEKSHVRHPVGKHHVLINRVQFHLLVGHMKPAPSKFHTHPLTHMLSAPHIQRPEALAMVSELTQGTRP